MTAFRVMPPSSAAIWLADSPSAHNFFRSSTLSSVQPIGFSPQASRPWMESNPVVRRPIGRQTHTRQGWTRNRWVTRDVVLPDREATIGGDSHARSCKPPRLATNRFSFRIGTYGTIESLVPRVDTAGPGNRIKKVPPGEAAHFFS